MKITDIYQNPKVMVLVGLVVVLTDKLESVDENVPGEHHVEPPEPGVLTPVPPHGLLQSPPLGETGYEDCGAEEEAHRDV